MFFKELLLLVLFFFALFSFSCQKHEEKVSTSSFLLSPLNLNLSYAGWGALNLAKNLSDGFAIYGCNKVKLKDVKIASVNYDGMPDLSFFGAVGGMGEIVIEGDSYISGDLVYPPGGTFSVSGETNIKGYKYAWGVSECPWWSFENASKWTSWSSYPETLTISSKVTFKTGEYRFKLLDIEQGGELYGEGVSIVADKVVVNGGEMDIGKGIVIAKYVNINSGFIRGRLFADSVQGENVEIEGKIVGNDVSISGGKVFYNGDVLCKDDTCRILYSIEVSEGVIEKKFKEITTSSISILTQVLYSSKECQPGVCYCCEYGLVVSEVGLSYLLNLARVMKKLNYCLSGVNTDDPDEGVAYTTWVTSVSHKPINIFYLQRILNSLDMKGRESGKLLPFRLVGVELRPFNYNYSDVVTAYNAGGYLKRLESINLVLNNSEYLREKWKEYANWVISNCSLPDKSSFSTRLTPGIDGKLEMDSEYSNVFTGQLKRILERNEYNDLWVFHTRVSEKDKIILSALGGVWSGLEEMNYFSPTLLDYFHVLYNILPLLDPEKYQGKVSIDMGYPFRCVENPYFLMGRDLR